MKAFQTDLERAVTSAGFVLAVVGTILALIAGTFSSLWVDMDLVKESGLNYGYHWQLLKQGLQSEAFTFALPILSTLGFGGAYLEEMKSGYYKFSLPRYGRRTYVVSKVVVSSLSGGLGVWLGVLFAALLFWAFFSPLEICPEDGAITGRVAAVLYEFADGAIKTADGMIVGVEPSGAIHSNMLLALLQWTSMTFLMGGTWAGIGCLFAILYRNRYMAYGAAFLISYLIIILITRFFDHIYIFNPREWFSQNFYWEGGNLGVIGLLAECMLILMLVNGVLMHKKLSPV